MAIDDPTITGVLQDVSGPTASLDTSLLTLDDGRTAVAWTEVGNVGVMFRLYDRDGNPEGPAIAVSPIDGLARRPSLVELSDGSIVVVYEIRNFAGPSVIASRAFSADGQPLSERSILIESEVFASQSPIALALSDGGFVVEFRSLGRDGSAFGQFVQVFDADASPRSEVSQVNQTTKNNQFRGQLTELNDGGFAVAWDSEEVDGSFLAVMLRIYNADGTPRGDERRVNEFSFRRQDNADIATLADGRLVLTWESDTQDGSEEGIYARVLDSNGVPIGSEFRINTTTLDDQRGPSIAPKSDGGFVILWLSDLGDAGNELRLQSFDAQARPDGQESILDTSSNELVFSLGISARDGEDFQAVYFLNNSNVPGGSIILNSFNLEAFRERENETPVEPTAGDDTLLGTVLDDRIEALGGNDNVTGLAGDDLLLGRGGDDSIRGSAGNDSLRGNGGDDTLRGNGGEDDINGNGGEDVIRGNGGDDVIRAGGGADNVKGGGGSDVIFGGGGADRLNGGGGADTLRGNGGDDTLKGNGGADVFQFRVNDRNDTIADFRQGQDKIQIQSGANSFEALRIEQDARDVLISFGAAGQIRVITDNASAFDEDDFIF